MKNKTSLMLILLLLLSSCKTLKQKCLDEFPPSVDHTETRVITNTEQVHDTTLVTEKDSSSIKALLACDSLGNVYLKQLLGYTAGKHAQPPQLDLNKNTLTAKCTVDSHAVYMAWKSTHTTDSAASVTKETINIPVNYLTGWQWFQVWLGRIFGALLILGAVYLVVKLIKLW